MKTISCVLKIKNCIDLKKGIGELQCAFSTSHEANLGDHQEKKNLRISGIVEQAGESSEQLLAKVRNFVTTELGLVGNSVIFAFRSGHSSPSQPQSRAIVAKMSSYEHKTSCLKNSAKLKGTNIFLNEDLSPATQIVCISKMKVLQAAGQRGLIAYFSRTKIVTRMKRSTHSSHDNVATHETAEGTAARVDTSGYGSTVQVEAARTGSTDESGEASAASVQARWATTATAQAPLIPQPTKQVTKEGFNTSINSSRKKFIK